MNNYESVTDSNKIYSDDRVCLPKLVVPNLWLTATHLPKEKSLTTHWQVYVAYFFAKQKKIITQSLRYSISCRKSKKALEFVECSPGS